MRQFNGMDSMFFYMDAAHAGMHGAFLQVYAPLPGEDPEARFLRLKRHIEGQLDASPVFRRGILRSALDLDHPWWVEGIDIDIDHHVQHERLPVPGNMAQLTAAYARHYAEPMDLSRPLWQIHVIDGLDAVPGLPVGSFGLVVKFHHAGADGVSATEITSALHSLDPEQSEVLIVPRKPTALPKPPPMADSLRRTAALSSRFGSAIASEVGARLPGLGRKLLRHASGSTPAIEGRTRKPRGAAPRSLINVAITSERSYTYLAMDLEAIKGIRRLVPDATVNDVFLAVVGGALRRFLSERQGLPKVSLVAGVPFNVRVENERGQAGNQFTIMPVPLRTDEPDALRRLERIVERSSQAKQAMRGAGGRRSANWFKLLPAPLLAIGSVVALRLRLAARMAPLINLVVTNVPGPRETLYLDGHRLLDINGAPPVVDGLGLIVAASSYDNALRVAIAGCRQVMPDPALMRSYFEASFAEYLAAVEPQPAASAAKPRNGRQSGKARQKAR